MAAPNEGLQLEMKNIVKLVVPRVAPKWEELGYVLLTRERHPAAQLEAIKLNHPRSSKKCCMDMFQFWLDTDTTANWEQLITALCSDGVDLAVVAEDLMKKLSDNPPQKHCNYTDFKLVREMEKYGPDRNPFSWPYLLTKGPSGELIVANNAKESKGLVVFDKQLKHIRDIHAKAYEENFEGMIRGATVDKGGFVYVTDGKVHCIKKFGLHDGKFISQFGTEGTKNGEFRQPAGLLISSINLLYVCDRLNHRIQVFHGRDFLFKFGKFAGMWEPPGDFNEPVDLTMNNSEDTLYVTDFRCHRVQMFTPGGVFVKQIKNVDDSYCLRYPNGIFSTPDDHLLVASTNCVLIFDTDGTYISAIKGRHEMITRFSDCIGVVMMDDGKIVVADGRRGFSRLVVFESEDR